MKFKALLILLFMLTGAAWAQAPEDPTARIAWLQEAEHSLLNYRRSLLDQEADLAEPLWIVNDEGIVTVVDGGPIYDNAAVLAELAASFAIDETINDSLVPGASQALRTVAEMVAAGRVRDVRAAVKAAYETPSYEVRNAALAEIERRLAAVRELVTATLQERDGPAATEPVTDPDIDDWRAQLARFGASLPLPEGDLVEPPSYDGDRCDPRPNPVYIEVLEGEGTREACSRNNWQYRSGGLTRPEGQGSCVWCPSGYYFRSGWGCCFPE